MIIISLQVWLSLNGNLNNQGVGELTTASVQSGVAIDNNGKIGKCYTNSGSNACVSTPIVFNSNQFSLCAWVKVNSRRNNWCRALGLVGSGTYIGLGCEHTNGSSYGFHFYKTIDGNNTSIFDTYPLSSQNGSWVHYAMCYDGTKYYIYQNGTLIQSNNANKSNIPVNMTSLLLFGGIGGTYANCSLNDVRLYDECISPKMVKEISKGLCCHYKLSNQYETGQVNKYSGNVAEGYLTGNFTRTKLEDERGYNYKLTYTGTGSNMWASMKAGNFSFTAGKKYYYSCKVRCRSKNFALYLRASRSDNDWVTSSTNVLSKADGEWHEYYVAQTINSTYDRSGSTVTSNPTLEFYTDNLITSGKVYSADFDIKDVQVIESDCYVPFIDNSMTSTVVSDCSGYGNNGTKVGTIAWSGDSARYSGSYYFASNSHYKIPCSLTSPQEFSCSFWIKPISWGGYAIISSNYNNPSSGFWLAVNCEGDGLWFFNGNYARSNKGLLSRNTWYHVCFVFNKGIITWYQNGEVAGTTDLSSKTTTLGIKDYISIGNSYTGTTWNTNYMGNISDFRIYATALSESDVKSLYNVSASIDKTGVLSAYEFCEEG